MPVPVFRRYVKEMLRKKVDGDGGRVAIAVLISQLS
jgi:hypothetical protein